MKQTVIGLAGHIDHGKTAIVKALTGVNTDLLSEEQKRGMTIDIGFAFLTDNITLIDVPGHEKFVKNMMAGVSSIDVALLVVAADDGIMPQTREHFEILCLLDIPLAVIAITKTDLADEDWLELIELEITELVSGTFMENAPMIRVSSETGNGIEELRGTLVNICKTVPDKKDRGIFRLNVDRVFSIKGYGTVVTGTVSSGCLKAGDSIEIIPRGVTARVRGLQSHGSEVDFVNLGDRAAINLQGVEKNNIMRGSQLATPGYFQSVNQVGVKLKLLNSAPKSIVQNQRIRIHLGTQEAMARIALIGSKILKPGAEVPALLRLESPLVAARGDKFILRSYSPVLTIGGGEIMEILIKEKWKAVKNKILALYESSESEQLLQLVQQESANPLTPKQLQVRLGISAKQIQKWVSSEEKLFWLSHNKSKWLLTRDQWSILKEKAKGYLMEYHKANPFQAGVQKEEIRQHLKCDDSLLDVLLHSMLDEKRVSRKGKVWMDPSFSITLNNEDQNMQVCVLNTLNEEGFTSSSLDQLAIKTGYKKDKLMRILNVAEQEGKLLRIDGDLMFTQKNFIDLKDKVVQYFKSSDILSVPQFKELAKTSRKYAVPLLEYFDKQKITYRDGNSRKLVK